MAARGNVFALLEVDDDGDSLLSIASNVAAVDKRTGNNNETRSSSPSSVLSSSAPQRNSDHEKESEKCHGSERNNRNVNRSGFLPNNGQVNGFPQNNSGYQKKVEISNGNQKKEEQTEDGWQVVLRSNGKKQSKAPTNVIRRNYVRRDKQHLKESGTNRVSNGSVETKCTDNSRLKCETEYQRCSRFENTAEGKDNGKPESFHEKEVQKDSCEQGSQGGEVTSRDGELSKGNHDKVVVKEETERRTFSKEEIERRALEAKQMTLKQYEKKVEEKRKSLENMKSEERRVAVDKEFESMQMIERKREETSFVRVNSATDKLKNKKKDKGNADMVKYLLVPPRRPRARRAPVSLKEAAAPPLSFQDAEQFPALGLAK